MQHIVTVPTLPVPRILGRLLPKRLLDEIEARLGPGLLLEEIRLRRNRRASLTVQGANLALESVLDGAEMDALLPAFCEGSLYAHADTVCRGFVTLQGGIRVGICGRASTVGTSVSAVCEISTFAIRIPHDPPLLGDEICTLIKSGAGVLIYSLPGTGKTTLLRAVAAQLSGGSSPIRVALVDTRGELCAGLHSPALLLDVLSGYPRGLGISIAARTLSAQAILCDEIGDLEEAREICATHAAGVPLLASAHAADIRDLLARPGMRLLHETRCFGYYVGLSRCEGAFDFHYDILTHEAADAFC